MVSILFGFSTSDPAKVQNTDEGDVSLEATEQSLSISNLQTGKSVSLLVPHTDASSMNMMVRTLRNHLSIVLIRLCAASRYLSRVQH